MNSVRVYVLGLVFGFDVQTEEMASVPFRQGFGLTTPMGRLYMQSDAFCAVWWVLRWCGVDGQREMNFRGHDLGIPQIDA